MTKSVQKWEKMKIHFLPFLDTFVSKIRENVSRKRRNNKKCLEIGENVFSHFQTHFVVSPVSRHLFSYFQTQKCLEMGGKGFSFSPISRHLLLFLLFLDTFSLILDPKVSINGNSAKPSRTRVPNKLLDVFCRFSCFQTLLGAQLGNNDFFDRQLLSKHLKACLGPASVTVLLNSHLQTLLGLK